MHQVHFILVCYYKLHITQTTHFILVCYYLLHIGLLLQTYNKTLFYWININAENSYTDYLCFIRSHMHQMHFI